jgi:hypothetical protein
VLVLPLVLRSQTEKRRAILLPVFVLLYVVLTLLPWTIRNWVVLGKPIPATTHGGYTFLLANNGPFYEYLRSGEPGTTWDADELGSRWAGKAKFSSPAEELRANHDAYREACSHIRREPGMFFYSCLVRAGRLWALMPHQGATPVRYAIGLWYLIVYVLALVGLWTLWRRRAEWRDAWRTVFVWGVMLIVMTTAIHTFFWSNMRMRAPLIPVLAIVATVGLARFAPRQCCNSGSKSEV